MVVLIVVGTSDMAKTADAGTLLKVTGIIIGISFILIGILGVAAGCTSNKCLIFLYQVFVIIFVAGFVALVIAIEVVGGITLK